MEYHFDLSFLRQLSNHLTLFILHPGLTHFECDRIVTTTLFQRTPWVDTREVGVSSRIGDLPL
ncbi:MAG TPA: hypothetical protein V6C85_38490 [Allocoleopsis sp.]